MIKNLVEKYGSDKNSSGYSVIYDELFLEYKNKEIDVLEIGIGTLEGNKSNMVRWKEKRTDYTPGASLKVWEEYFQEANIYGIDIIEDCMINEGRIKTFLCDSTVKESVENSVGEKKFDIIIDDGLHTFEAQNETFLNFYPKLKDGGIYFIEDIRFMDRFLTDESILVKMGLEFKFNEKRNLLWVRK